MLLPIGVALFYGEADFVAFLLTFCAALASGLCGLFTTRKLPNAKKLAGPRRLSGRGFILADLFRVQCTPIYI